MLIRADRMEEAMCVQYLLGLAMLAAGKNNQGCEILQKLRQRCLLGETTDSRMQMAAKIQLIISDAVVDEDKRNQVRVEVLISTGKGKRVDVEIATELAAFACACLVDEQAIFDEAIALTAVRTMRGLIEEFGCSLGMTLQDILGATITSFIRTEKKKRKSQRTSGGGEEESLIKRKNTTAAVIIVSTLESVLMREYLGLQETLCTVLASTASQILRSIFAETVVPLMQDTTLPTLSRVFLLNIAEKIIAICQGDLQVDISFFDCLLFGCDYFSVGVPSSERMSQKDLMTISGCVQQLFTTVKSKMLVNMSRENLSEVVFWIAEMMLGLLAHKEEEETEVAAGMSDGSASRQYLVHMGSLLELVSVILSLSSSTNDNIAAATATTDPQEDMIQRFFKKLPQSNKQKKKGRHNHQQLHHSSSPADSADLSCLVKPLILWVEHTLSAEDHLDVFHQVWVVLSGILKRRHRRSSPPSAGVNMNSMAAAAAAARIANNERQYDGDSSLLFEIAHQLLEKVREQLSASAPTPAALRFLKIVVTSLPSIEGDGEALSEVFSPFIQGFFFEFCLTLPHCVHGDVVFDVFDALIRLIKDSALINRAVINASIECLLSRFTERSVRHKQSLMNVQRILMEVNRVAVTDKQMDASVAGPVNEDCGGGHFLEVLSLCVSENEEPMLLQIAMNGKERVKQRKSKKLMRDSKEFETARETFVSLLAFALSCLEQASYSHFVDLLPYLHEGSAFNQAVRNLLLSEQLEIRVAGISLLKVFLERFIATLLSEKQPGSNTNDVGYSKVFADTTSKLVDIDEPQLVVMRFVLDSIRIVHLSFDGLLQFNCLLIYDLLFQTVLNGSFLDIELSEGPCERRSINMTELIVGEQYTRCLEESKQKGLTRFSNEFQQLRIAEINRLVPFISTLVNSPWSNIRSLSYGLICYWVKPLFVSDYEGEGWLVIQPLFLKREVSLSGMESLLLSSVMKVIEELISSEESECRTGGLNIMGSLCGLGYGFEDAMNRGIILDKLTVLGFFRRGEAVILPRVWEIIYHVQFDWDITNKAAALALVQLCAPFNLIRHLDVMNAGRKMVEEEEEEEQEEEEEEGEEGEDDTLFWLHRLEVADIYEYISMFKNEYTPPSTLWIERIPSAENPYSLMMESHPFESADGYAPAAKDIVYEEQWQQQQQQQQKQKSSEHEEDGEMEDVEGMELVTPSRDFSREEDINFMSSGVVEGGLEETAEAQHEMIVEEGQWQLLNGKLVRPNMNGDCETQTKKSPPQPPPQVIQRLQSQQIIVIRKKLLPAPACGNEETVCDSASSFGVPAISQAEGGSRMSSTSTGSFDGDNEGGHAIAPAAAIPVEVSAQITSSIRPFSPRQLTNQQQSAEQSQTVVVNPKVIKLSVQEQQFLYDEDSLRFSFQQNPVGRSDTQSSSSTIYPFSGFSRSAEEDLNELCWTKPIEDTSPPLFDMIIEEDERRIQRAVLEDSHQGGGKPLKKNTMKSAQKQAFSKEKLRTSSFRDTSPQGQTGKSQQTRDFVRKCNTTTTPTTAAPTTAITTVTGTLIYDSCGGSPPTMRNSVQTRSRSEQDPSRSPQLIEGSAMGVGGASPKKVASLTIKREMKDSSNSFGENPEEEDVNCSSSSSNGNVGRISKKSSVVIQQHSPRTAGGVNVTRGQGKTCEQSSSSSSLQPFSENLLRPKSTKKVCPLDRSKEVSSRRGQQMKNVSGHSPNSAVSVSAVIAAAAAAAAAGNSSLSGGGGDRMSKSAMIDSDEDLTYLSQTTSSLVKNHSTNSLPFKRGNIQTGAMVAGMNRNDRINLNLTAESEWYMSNDDSNSAPATRKSCEKQRRNGVAAVAAAINGGNRTQEVDAKERLMQKLIRTKALDVEELKSVIKLHQQKQSENKLMLARSQKILTNGSSLMKKSGVGMEGTSLRSMSSYVSDSFSKQSQAQQQQKQPPPLPPQTRSGSDTANEETEEEKCEENNVLVERDILEEFEGLSLEGEGGGLGFQYIKPIINVFADTRQKTWSGYMKDSRGTSSPAAVAVSLSQIITVASRSNKKKTAVGKATSGSSAKKKRKVQAVD